MGPSLIIAALAVGAPGPKGPGPDPSGIAGEWEVVEAKTAGQHGPNDAKAGDVYAFEADGTLRFRFGGKVSPLPPFRYTADPAAKPATVDIRVDDKADSPVSRGRFKVDGATLTLHLGELNADRPPGLAPPAAAKTTVITFRRVKAKD